jgi:hypothetical protein
VFCPQARHIAHGHEASLSAPEDFSHSMDLDFGMDLWTGVCFRHVIPEAYGARNFDNSEIMLDYMYSVVATREYCGHV